jgi:hypothetical protein
MLATAAIADPAPRGAIDWEGEHPAGQRYA